MTTPTTTTTKPPSRALAAARLALSYNYREDWALDFQTITDLAPHVALAFERYAREEAPRRLWARANALIACEPDVSAALVEIAQQWETES